MEYTVKLRRIGNSVGVVLPKELLSQLVVKEGDMLYIVKSDDGSFNLKAKDADFVRKMAAVDDIAMRYRHTLQELAK